MPLDLAVSMISVDDALLELGQTDADHLKIERLINEASYRIEAFCDRPFKARNVVLTFDGHGESLLSLGGPVQQVITVTILSQAVGVANTDIATADYLVNPRRGVIYYAAGFPVGFQNVQVSCRIGEDPINPSIKGACLDLVKHLYRQPESSDLMSERIGDYAYSRFPKAQGDPNPDIPDDLQAKLLPYKRWSFL